MTRPRLSLVRPPAWTVAVRAGERVALPVRHVEAVPERVPQSPELRRRLMALALERPE